MAARISKQDSERIVAAIKKAEKKTSGEIRVHIQKTLDGEIMKAAVAKFNELEMTATAERNAVLIFIARDAKQLSILGDEGIHGKVGSDFWTEAVEAMTGLFKAGDFIGGIEAGVLKAGEALSKHFPRKSSDVNELPDEVTVG